MGRYFAKDWKRSWEEKPRKPRRKRPRLLSLLLMLIGAVTVLFLALRYLIVPLLVFLGGIV